MIGRLQHTTPHAPGERSELPLQMPGPPARIAYLATRREAQLPDRRPRDHPLDGLPVNVTHQPHHELHAIELQRAAHHIRAQRLAAVLAQQVDHRRPLRRTDRDPRVHSTPAPAASAGPAPRAQDLELPQRARQVDRVSHQGLRVVGHRDHRVLLQEGLDAAGGLHHTRQLQVRARQRLHLALRTVLVRVPVVVRQRQQHEVAEVVLDHVRAHTARVLVAHARHPQRRVTARATAREDVRVEQLPRTHHRVAHQRARRDPRQCAVALGLVAVAPAVDQVGRARRPHAGVVERLEDRQRLAREVRAVHVVDRVRQLPRDPKALHRTEARAVFDVARLLAVVPVHRRDPVALLARPRRDRRRAHRRHRGKRRRAVGDVAPASHQLAQHRRRPLRDRALQHRRRHRVDHAEHQLRRRQASASQDPQPGVPLALAATARQQQPREREQREVAQRVQQRHQRRQQQRRAVDVQRHRLARPAIRQARRARAPAAAASRPVRAPPPPRPPRGPARPRRRARRASPRTAAPPRRSRAPPAPRRAVPLRRARHPGRAAGPTPPRTRRPPPAATSPTAGTRSRCARSPRRARRWSRARRPAAPAGRDASPPRARDRGRGRCRRRDRSLGVMYHVA